MITISIDLRKIDQSRCKKMVLKSGENASFCSLVLIETPNSEYGDFMVKQDTTKEEREQKVQMPILGNGKTVGKGRPQQQRQEPDDHPQRRERPAPPARRERPAPPAQRKPPADPDFDDSPRDDLPF